MADQLLAGLAPVFDDNGKLVAGGSVTFYETNTTEKVDIWADINATIPLENPLFLDAAGRPSNQIFYVGTVAVKEVIKDADGATLYVVDPSPRFSVTAAAAREVTFAPSTNNPNTNVQDAIDRASGGVSENAYMIGVVQDFAEKIGGENATNFDSVADLLASTIGMGANTVTQDGEDVTLTVSVGDIHEVKGGHPYKVVALPKNVQNSGGLNYEILPKADGSVALSAWGLPFDGSVAHDVSLAQAQSIDGVTCIYGPGMSANNTIRLDATMTFLTYGPDINFGQCTIDTSRNSGRALLITGDNTDTPNPYTNGARFILGHWVGAGRGSASHWAKIEGIDSNGAARGFEISHGSVSYYGRGFVLGNNGYLTNLVNVDIFQCGITVDIPAGLLNAGENIKFTACAFYNSDLAFKIAHDCGVQLLGCSVDYNMQILQASAPCSFVMTGGHIEFDATGTNLTQIFTSHPMAMIDLKPEWVTVRNAQDASPTVPYFFNIAGAARLTGARVYGINTTTGFKTGAGRMVLRDNHYSPISFVNGSHNQNSVQDPNFATGGLNGNDISITTDWDAGGVIAVTNRHVGTGIVLSTTAWNPPAGKTRSMSVAKKGSTGADTSFTLAVPCNVGDLFHSGLKCRNPDGRSGGVIFALDWLSARGNDANGVPQFGRKNFASFTFNPTATWADYAPNNRLAADLVRYAPAGTTHFGIRIILTNWVGGASGAAEDGGQYKLYFGDFFANQF